MMAGEEGIKKYCLAKGIALHKPETLVSES